VVETEKPGLSWRPFVIGNSPGLDWLNSRTGLGVVGIGGPSVLLNASPLAVTISRPSPSIRAALTVVTDRPARTTSVSVLNPAIGTGRLRSATMRTSRLPGSLIAIACSKARARIPVGGPAWHDSGSHGPRHRSVGVNQSPVMVKYESLNEGRRGLVLAVCTTQIG